MNHYKFLGIDPGLVRTGWAIVSRKGNNVSYLSSGVINTNAEDTLPARLLEIKKELLKIAELYVPNSAAIEEIYVNSNNLSSLKLAHARGSALVALASYDLPITEYHAKTVKKTICGSGTADKEQIARMLAIFFPNLNIRSTDESDALSVALCHAIHST